MNQRHHELAYDRTTGKDREYHYREWRRIVSELPIVTAPEQSSTPKRIRMA